MTSVLKRTGGDSHVLKPQEKAGSGPYGSWTLLLAKVLYYIIRAEPMWATRDSEASL